MEALLAPYPTAIRDLADGLRGVVERAVPHAAERVRSGWRLIGYEVPDGRRSRYFAYVAPEMEHVHLGFEYGRWLSDPAELLHGAHLGLRRVRYLTFRPGDVIPAEAAIELTRSAARVALLPRSQRLALELERGLGLDAPR